MAQQSLFQIDEAPWEADDAGEKLVASLVFPTGPDKTFDYEVPDELRGEIEVGRRVRAPFGRGDRPAMGYCVALDSRKNQQRKLKKLAALVDRRRLLTPAMLQLTEWLTERYLCTRGQALEAVLPAVVREQETTRTVTLLSVSKRIAAGLDKLELPPKQAAITQAPGSTDHTAHPQAALPRADSARSDRSTRCVRRTYWLSKRAWWRPKLPSRGRSARSRLN